MQKTFITVFTLTLLYLIFISINQFKPEVFDNSLSKFLGGIGGFIYPFIVGLCSLLFSIKKESGENFVKILNEGFKSAEIVDSNFGVEGKIDHKNIDIKNKDFGAAVIKGSNFGIKNNK